MISHPTVLHSSIELNHQPVPADQQVSGQSSTGHCVLWQRQDLDGGIWEITPGVVTDTEAEELFVVLTGRAEIEFLDTGKKLIVGPGDVCVLPAGASTRWTVFETLRKVYVAKRE